MNIKVMYFSRGGNTKKVAEAIAKSINLNAEVVPIALPPHKLDILFLGSGIYMGKVDNRMKEFVASLDRNVVTKVAVFGTGMGKEKVVGELVRMLREKNISVANETFYARGAAFGLFNRNHPDEADLKAAQEFAQKVVDRYSPK